MFQSFQQDCQMPRSFTTPYHPPNNILEIECFKNVQCTVKTNNIVSEQLLVQIHHLFAILAKLMGQKFGTFTIGIQQPKPRTG
jgi:hypothetical protein